MWTLHGALSPGVLLLQNLHWRAHATGWLEMMLEQLCPELWEAQQVDLAYVPKDQRSAPKMVSVRLSQSVTQESLVQALGIDWLFPKPAEGGRQYVGIPP